jgi:mono/diheme cytochrome c family protein
VLGPVRLRALAVVAVGAALLLTACGGEETTGFSGADVANGEELFLNGEAGGQACGGCHTLAAAGTMSDVGPNLDDAFGFACRQGFDNDTFYSVVLGQIAEPARNSQMPADLVTGQDAVDVAAYVATVAGQNVEGCETAGGGGTTTEGTTTGG